MLPDGIEFPNGSDSYWVPLTLDPAQFNRGTHFLNCHRAAAPMGSRSRRRSEALNGVAAALGEAYPSTNAGQGVELVDLKQQLNGDAPRLLGDSWRGDRRGAADRVHERREPARGARVAARVGAGAAHGHRRHRPPAAASTARRTSALLAFGGAASRLVDGRCRCIASSSSSDCSRCRERPRRWRGRPTWRSR